MLTTINNISSILHNRDFSLHIRRVILANYFVDVCRNNAMLGLVNSKHLESVLKEDIITLYGRPYIATDSKIHDIVVPFLIGIISNPNNYSYNVYAAALISLSTYKERYIIDNIESIISHVGEHVEILYGPLAEYLINMISYVPSFMQTITEKLYALIIRKDKYSDNAFKLFLDVVYKHYRLHQVYSGRIYFWISMLIHELKIL